MSSPGCVYWYLQYVFGLLTPLKVVGNARYWSRTVVIDVCFSMYLAAILEFILFQFPPTHAEKLVIDRLISTGCKMTVLLITHH
jgi:hypothetical protein